MRNVKEIAAVSIIFSSIILITLGFVVLKFAFHEDIPDFVFLILGIAALIAPLTFLLVQKSTMKRQEKESQQPSKSFANWLYIIGMCIILIITFFTVRDFFLPLLLCNMPMFIFFVYADIKSRSTQQSNNTQS